MIPTLYREDLDSRKCENPECKHEPSSHAIYIHAKCHNDGKVACFYLDGELYFECHACGKPLAKIAVASRDPVTAITE